MLMPKRKYFLLPNFFYYLIFFRTSLYFEEELFLNDANYFFIWENVVHKNQNDNWGTK